MNIFQQRQYERFVRATQFIDAHNNAFDPTSQAIVLNAQLKESLGEVHETTPSAHQETAKPKASSSSKKAALNELRAELDRIATTAKALKKIDPDFKGNFELPDKRLKEKLVVAAQQFQKDAAPLKARFLAYELRSDFLETLSAKLEAYQAMQTPSPARPKGPKPKSANTSVAFDRAAQLMDVLDVVVKNKYEGDTAALEAWTDATRLNTPARKRRTESGADAEPKFKRKPRGAKS